MRSVVSGLFVLAAGMLLPAAAWAGGGPCYCGQPSYHAPPPYAQHGAPTPAVASSGAEGHRSFSYAPEPTPAPAMSYPAHSYPSYWGGYGGSHYYYDSGRAGYGSPGRFSYSGYNYRNAASKALYAY